MTEHVVGVKPYDAVNRTEALKKKPRWLAYCSCGWSATSHEGSKGKQAAQEDALAHQAEHRG